MTARFRVPPLPSLLPSRKLLPILLTAILFPTALLAQSPAGTAPDAPTPTSAPAPPTAKVKLPLDTHHFWDKENDWLFAGVAASRALDFSSTLNFRRRGRDEVFLTNDLVDDHAAFAAVEAGATGLSVGLSYVFHHYGHHKLERWTSIVHMTVATGGAIRNYSLKSAHPTSSISSSGVPASSLDSLRH